MPRQLQLDDSAPWKQRFRAPVTFPGLAKSNPSRGLATSNRSGVFQLYAWDVPSGELRQLTDRPEGKATGAISPDGRYVYYLDDERGNEIGHYVRVPFEGGAPEDITPQLPPYSGLWGLRFSRASNLAGGVIAGAEGYQLYTVALQPGGGLGEPRRLFQSAGLTVGPVLSHAGEIAVVGTAERPDKFQFTLVAIDTATAESIGELSDGPESSVEPTMFSPLPGDLRLLATTNRSGVKRPFLWNPRTGTRTGLQLDDLQGEVEPRDWSPDGRYLLLCQYTNAVQRLYLYDLDSNTATPLRHPGGSYGGTYFAPAGEIWAQWSNSTQPAHLIALDGTTGEQTRVVLPPGPVPPGRPWRSITFPSSDGQIIQGWLAVPEGDGPFPAILETHGGPTAVMPELFSPGSQAWLDHGFAFLTINYRGSTTFGREFEEQIHGDFGHWEVEDMVAARAWLVREGIASPGQILLAGWSYGGYLTLQALGLYPDLWAGGMAGIAIADWKMLYEDSAGTLKGYLVATMQGTPEEKPEQYARSSPITYIENVRAPILIIQGSNDTRTPARPIKEYEAKMRALGNDIEVHWFEAGHGRYVVGQQIEHQELMLRFAARVLG